MNASRYDAPFDAVVLTITVATTLGLTLTALWAAYIFTLRGSGQLGSGLFIASLVLVLALSYAFAPNGYRLERDALVIERPIGPLTIALAGLQGVGPYVREGYSMVGYRNGGLFGVYGRTRRPSGGWICFWGRRIKGIVALRFPDRTVLVMPGDPERFARDVESRLGRPS
jgi:hypothetical protein